jgi:hypothetical protein
MSNDRFVVVCHLTAPLVRCMYAQPQGVSQHAG